MSAFEGAASRRWIEQVTSRIEQSPIAKRVLAFISDYLLGGIASMLPLSIVGSIIGAGTIGDLSTLIAGGLSILQLTGVVLLSFVISFAYFVIVPLKLWPGQTVGKRLAGIEVVMLDGSPASLKALMIRWAFMVFVETFFSINSSFVIQLLELTSGGASSSAFALLGGAVSIVSALRVFRDGERRALHDVMAGTWVYTNE